MSRDYREERRLAYRKSMYKSFKNAGVDYGAAYSKQSRNRARAARAEFLSTPGLGRRLRAPRGAIAPFGGRKELKYVDNQAATYVADSTGTVTALNLTAIGDDNTSRDGRQVTIKSVQIHGRLQSVDNVATLSSRCRLMLIWDNAVNSGTIATIAQILTQARSDAFPLIDNAQRFTVLYDNSWGLGALVTTATQTFAQSPGTHVVDIYKKINAVTQYSGTTAAIGSIQNGALLMVTLGDQAAGDGGSFVLSTRVRFTDD